jgi:hypothetical protein
LVFITKNIFVASVLVLATVPCFAADIASNASSAQCVEPTLHRYEGTANLQAEWEANTIQLRWYNNNTLITPTDAIDDCEYAGSLTRPSNPSRIGFTFNGWKVRPLIDFSNLNNNLGVPSGNEYGKGVYYSADYCLYYDGSWHGGAELCKQPEFTELQQQEWKQGFTNGTVYGMSHCSALPGNNYSTTWPAENRANYTSTLDAMNTYDSQHTGEEKKYCWCRATGYKTGNPAVVKGSLSPLTWVFVDTTGSSSGCTRDCAVSCADRFRWHSAFRAAVFKAEN